MCGNAYRRFQLDMETDQHKKYTYTVVYKWHCIHIQRQIGNKVSNLSKFISFNVIRTNINLQNVINLNYKYYFRNAN